MNVFTKKSSEKRLRYHRKKKHKSLKHKSLKADVADEYIEQLDGNTSLHLHSPTNRSAKVKETTEDDMDLAHLLTADDPDNICKN